MCIMCGIFGYVGEGVSPEILVEGIRRLEYRGYDSWGISFNGKEKLYTYKAEGRIPEVLPEDIPSSSIKCGIAHTRWATHGSPTQINAHPHTDCAGTLALVHNGIIENSRTLRKKLEKLGHTFKSETDSEVVAHLIEQFIKEGLEFRLAFLEALKSVEGTYGIAVISHDSPDKIYLGKMSSPLVIGKGEGFTVVASDSSAIVQHTRDVIYLDDGECAMLSKEGIESFKLDETPTVKEVEKLMFDFRAIELGGFNHFMEKEIHEQPQSILDAIRGRLSKSEGTAVLGGVGAELLGKIKRLKIIACGTSWHAALIGKYMFEQLAGIPAEVCYSAEFRYANPAIEPDTLVIAISQSGETADTLAGIQEAKRLGFPTLGIVNVVGSSIARECEQGIFLHAGPEIGVASTKAVFESGYRSRPSRSTGKPYQTENVSRRWSHVSRGAQQTQ